MREMRGIIGESVIGEGVEGGGGHVMVLPEGQVHQVQLLGVANTSSYGG